MTQLEIYNAALASLGHDQTVASLTATTPEANWCNLFYDQGRKELLRLTKPTFAMRVEALDDVEDSELPEWEYQWPRPGSLLALESVRDENGDRIRFKLLADLILTIEDAGSVEFVIDEDDTEVFDPLFTKALISRLAADVALPLTGKADLRRVMEQNYQTAVSDFRLCDAQDGRDVGDPAQSNYYVSVRA